MTKAAVFFPLEVFEKALEPPFLLCSPVTVCLVMGFF